MVHPATGEGIYQGMRSGILAAEALRDMLTGASTEARAFERYESRCRLAYSASFAATRLLQPLIDSPVLDTVAKVLPKSLRNRATAAS
ncbi:NAD(P)/FAD-dependent oxidoreductase [Cystobacter fuscus]